MPGSTCDHARPAALLVIRVLALGAHSPPDRSPPPRRIGTPLRPRDFGWADAGILGASLFSSFVLVWVVFYQFTLLSGAFGFLNAGTDASWLFTGP